MFVTISISISFQGIMLKLPQITLCTLGSESYREQNQNALDYSSRDIEFGAVKNIIADTNSIDEWNHAIVFDLGNHIDTEFAILIHPDGFIVNPESWRDEFINYDYIGAPWPLPTDDYSYRTPDGEIVRVGNSVSLRSKKVLDLPRQLNLEWKSYYGNTNEDGFITCHNRRILQQNGVRFATLEVARYFSHETPMEWTEGIKPFAFHRHLGANTQYPNFEL